MTKIFNYRLNVVSIKVPPLRERRDDIPALVRRLLNEINIELHTKVTKITDDVMELIKQHDWPGNVRELQNVLTRAVVLSKSDVIDISGLQLAPAKETVSTSYNWNRTLSEVEQEHIEQVLKAVQGNRTEAAKILGISKPTLYSRIPSSKKAEP